MLKKLRQLGREAGTAAARAGTTAKSAATKAAAAVPRRAAVNPYETAQQAGQQLVETWGRHDIAVVLGSGWGDAVGELGELTQEMPVTELPGFAAPTVEGHSSSIASLSAGDKRVLLFRGRVHLYEGHSPHDVVHGVRVAQAAGCRAVILTNAAGGINPKNQPGSPVLISDHINLTGLSPLGGPAPPPPREVRFVDLTEAYSSRLRQLAKQVQPDIAEGVYAGLCGPHFETPAEIEMLARVGADMVGMSTVLECIAARHLDMEVLGVSLVTNLAAGLSGEPLDHEEVLSTGSQAGQKVGLLLRGVIDRL